MNRQLKKNLGKNEELQEKVVETRVEMFNELLKDADKKTFSEGALQKIKEYEKACTKLKVSYEECMVGYEQRIKNQACELHRLNREINIYKERADAKPTKKAEE